MTTVVVPWRGGCPHRERAWARVRGLYAERHPTWNVVVAEAPPGPWVKASAVMPLLEESPAFARVRNGAEVVLVADADVWTDGLAEAVEAVERGVPWAVPHSGVFRLTADATEEVLAGAEPREDMNLEQRPYKGTYGGGIVVARLGTLLDVPMDPRFVGWGQEDECWGRALGVLAGLCWRGKRPLFHLWHPHQERLTRRYGSPEAKQLLARYVEATQTDPQKMRELISEVSDVAGNPAESDLHDRQALR